MTKLVWLVIVDLAKSTVAVASEVITPTDHTEESVVAVTLPRESRDHQLLLVVAITLTPGTAVVDADRTPGLSTSIYCITRGEMKPSNTL